jgi:predicted 3-demethylubiquinone-9 3-methyltransferase (glyoxalase superfamily)/uncharacterized protein YndB with AHSA1/START domain
MPENKRTKSSRAPTDLKTLDLSRTIDAPRARIFRVWSTGTLIAQWWGPDGFTTPRSEVEFRTGGALRIDMRGPDGTIYPMTGRFEEVTPHRRIVFTATPLDATGQPIFEVRHALSFTERRGKTTVRLRAEVLSATPEAQPYLQGMAAGWTQQLGRLDAITTSRSEGPTKVRGITPFLWFRANAEEAVETYTSLFGDSRVTMIQRQPGADQGSEGPALVIGFELAGQKFIALNGGPEYALTPAYSIYVSCAGQAEVDRLWDRLCEGGEPSRCGWLVDRYGVSWQIIPKQLEEVLGGPDPAGAGRAFAAMMKMGKLDVRKLEEAYRGSNRSSKKHRR